MGKRVGGVHQVVVWWLMLMAGWGLAPAVGAAPLSGSTAELPGSGRHSTSEADDDDDLEALIPSATEVPARAGGVKAADSQARPAAIAIPITRADASAAVAPSTSDRERVRAAYKELMEVTGADEAWRQLNAGREGENGDAFSNRPHDADNSRRRAEASSGDDSRMAALDSPRTEEQRKLDEVRASLLFSALLEEVTPWLIAAVVIYAVVYGARVVLAYNRMKAERKRKRRKSTTRSRSTRLG